MNQLSRKIYDKEYEDNINSKNEAFLSLHIRLNNQGLERHAEHYINSWGTFFANIGGYLGLFLGKKSLTTKMVKLEQSDKQ